LYHFDQRARKADRDLRRSDVKAFNSALCALAIFCAAPAAADNDLVQGLIGGMIGAALMNQGTSNNNSGGTRKSSASSGMSAETRAKNKELQESLNYFGFDVGTPDGVLGHRTGTAISQFQACIGKSITGELNSFEDQFLRTSYFKAEAGGTTTLQIVASKPNGYCGLLQQYLQELSSPPAAAPVQVQAAAPAPVTEVVPAPVVQQQTVVVNSNQTNNTVIVLDADLQKKYDLLLNQVKLLEQIQSFVTSKEVNESSKRKLSSVDERLAELRELVSSVEVEAQGKYGTPIRPTNANLGVTAAKASEVFPRVPYYVPGTDETGELWIKPFVTDSGMLMYDFNFVTAHSDFDNIRETIELTAENIRSVAGALVKVTAWSDKAVSQGLRRNYEKSAFCFPAAMCGKVEEGNNSSEVYFVIYEDGSTAVRLQKNKGKFRAAFNLSIESGLLLSAYMDYMAEIGEKDFAANTMTDKDLDGIFQ